MVERAELALQGSAGRAILADLQHWDIPAAACSRVCARLVLHYLPELAPLLRKVHQPLRPDGLLVFWVEHPVITSCDRSWQGQGLRQEWIVDDYFRTGERSTDWSGSRVIKYHRTVEDYFLAVQSAGFRVDSLRESHPVRENFVTDEDFARRQRIPLFLLMAARKV